MRKVFFAGTAMAVVFLLANLAIKLLDQPSDLSVAAGYFLLLGLVSAGVGVVSRLVSRRRL